MVRLVIWDAIVVIMTSSWWKYMHMFMPCALLWLGTAQFYPYFLGLLHRHWVNTLRPRQNGRRFADDTFKRIFLNENVRISIEISLKFVAKGLINNIPALVQIMAWRRSGDKPLSKPMMIRLPTHICVTRPQWVNDIIVRVEMKQAWTM